MFQQQRYLPHNDFYAVTQINLWIVIYAVHLHEPSELNDSLKGIIVRYERANCIDGYTNKTKNTLIYIKQNIEQQQ